jgi:uncharacterized protein (TIGR00255 family)
MALASMTGFARASGELNGDTWTWEIKSVNGRGLDIRARLAPGYDNIEQKIRTFIAEHVSRGQLSVNLQLHTGTREQTVHINQQALDAVIAAAGELQRDHIAIAPSADGLLALRGVLELKDLAEDESMREAREIALLSSLQQAVLDFVKDRRSEGKKLTAVISAQLKDIASLISQAADLASTQPAMLRDRLEEKISTLLADRADLPEERLVQEAAMLAVKADIREELDRLQAHVTAAAELIEVGGPVGRRFDFLAQEFNREANTLCSKSTDTELTQIGLQLKTVIDQFREQVQNLE